MCTNDADNTLNALISAGANAPVVTVHYGPYMNWGRWNHNTRRIRALLEAFAKAKVSVQLQHDATETSWQDHGRVRVILADGTVIADEPHAQHNRNYSSIPATMQKVADTAVRALKAGLGVPSKATATATATATAKQAAPAATAKQAAPAAAGIQLATDLATQKVTDVAAAAN